MRTDVMATGCLLCNTV